MRVLMDHMNIKGWGGGGCQNMHLKIWIYFSATDCLIKVIISDMTCYHRITNFRYFEGE